MQRTSLIAVMAFALFWTVGASAQHSSHGSHGDHGSNAQTKKPLPRKSGTPSTREYHAAHAKMMRDMDKPFTGDPDVDFYAHMIPHHQGAIDMARVALRHAKDPWTRQAAEAIIIAQQQEIAQFQSALASRGVKPPAGGQPAYEIGANSFPNNTHKEGSLDGTGSRDELKGQTWAPGGGVPVQR